MIIQKLVIEQYRGVSARKTIEFNPKFSVIVGENGVGKTSVLWALRVLLSHAISKLTKNQLKSQNFSNEDIAGGWPYLRAETSILSPDGIHTLLNCSAQKNIGAFVRGSDEDGKPREHAVDTPDKYEVGVRSGITVAPLVVYYSPHRSLALDRGPTKSRSVGGILSAYAESLDDRELRLGEAALLWRKEAGLEETDGRPARANHAIQQALPVFLGEFDNIRVVGDEKPRLVIDKRGTTLDLNQLSDGERGLLAVLIDLTRRLSLANPDLEQPARDGRAIVLIDELDLHLHPKWQREVVDKLRNTFQNSQFIVTTHSPFVIQSIHEGELIRLDGTIDEPYENESIEDVSEDIMGVEIPQKSKKYLEMMHVATEYYRLLRESENDQNVDVTRLKNELDALSVRFSDNPFFAATLDFKWETFLAKKKRG